MTINKKTWIGGELISQAGLNQTSAEDAVNIIDDIHNQYLLGLTLVSGAKHVDAGQTDNGLSTYDTKLVVPFFFDTRFNTNLRAMMHFSTDDTNPRNSIMDIIDISGTIHANPISVAYTTPGLGVLLTTDFIFAKPSGNYLMEIKSSANVNRVNELFIGGSIVTLPVF